MKGLVPVVQSRTAILGWLAARAAGVLGQEAIASWLEKEGLAIGLRGLRDALGARMAAATPTADPADMGWVWESVDFDAIKLDLDLALVVFPSPDHIGNLVRDLKSTERVIRIYRSYENDVVGVLTYSGARERQRLQIFLEERQPDLQWLVIREVDDSSAAPAWLALAKKTARQEGLSR
ncbi:MAG: hypothetical protein QOF13_2250 [Solirubrobacterales bacterium]|jgi:hypothetical protein|nr:hypothetical protein [Solirubrobacterales bacterium]